MYIHCFNGFVANTDFVVPLNEAEETVPCCKWGCPHVLVMILSIYVIAILSIHSVLVSTKVSCYVFPRGEENCWLNFYDDCFMTRSIITLIWALIITDRALIECLVSYK